MTARTVRALRFLGLVDEGGYRTETFDQLRATSSSDMPSVLRRTLERAYSDVFLKIDLRNATDRDLDEAFRGYEPTGQRPRMVALFRGLATQAGLIARETPAPVSKSGPAGRPEKSALGGGYALLRGLLDTLPSARRWTSDERQRWLQAWIATLDLVVTEDGANAAE
jgi:hypothetical protein